MLTINVTTSSNAKRINGTVDGQKFNVDFSVDLYQQLKDLQAKLELIDTADEYTAWVDSVNTTLESFESTDNIIETACKDLKYNKETGKYYLQAGGKISKHAVPQPLVSVILESVEKDIDPTPIVKAWTRFLRNPNFSEFKAERFAAYITSEIIDFEELDKLIEEKGYSQEKALEAATYNDVAITTSGLIVCKKYARLLTEGWVIDQETNKVVKKPLFDTVKTVDQFSGEISETVNYPEFAEELTFEPPIQGRNGNAFYCGDIKDHIIKVGQKHTLKSWDLVDTNDLATCRPGLHVGGWNYVHNYGGNNRQLLECFVDPMEIGAICDISESSDGALRVREYFVYGAVDKRTKGIYHSSKYAEMKDAEWENMKREAVEAANKIVEQANELE